MFHLLCFTRRCAAASFAAHHVAFGCLFCKEGSPSLALTQGRLQVTFVVKHSAAGRIRICSHGVFCKTQLQELRIHLQWGVPEVARGVTS